MTDIDEANQILDKVQLPTGEESWLVLKYKDGSNVTKTSHTQQVYMGQELSKQVFGNTGKRFAVMPIQDSYDLMHSDEKYKKYAIEGFSHNRELFLESGLLIPDPQVRDVGGELKYILEAQMMASEGRLKSDKVVEVKINKSDVIDTLVRAGAMKEPTHKVFRTKMFFNNDGLASLGSGWDRRRECFFASTYGPSHGYDYDFAAFERLPSPQEKIDLEIAELDRKVDSDMARLKELSGKYAELKKQLKIQA